MSRYTGPASITLHGDKKLAAQYVSEGRKYLGALETTHPIQTAVRQLTNANGVKFRVGYYGGQPFIEITAGAPSEEKYKVVAIKGIGVSPVGASNNTLYDVNPLTWVVTKQGSYKKSLFHTPVSPLTSSSHPTDQNEVPYNFYNSVAPNLYTDWNAYSSNLSAGARMYWHSKKKDLYVYWGGVSHMQTGLNTTPIVHINGKAVLLAADLYAVYPGINTVSICGAAAKRTSKGLRLFISYVTQQYAVYGPFKLCVGYVDIEPTDAEKTRLAKLDDFAKLAGYAAEYVRALPANFNILVEIALPKDYNFSNWSACPFNQSVTECRTFIWAGSGGASFALSRVDELVIDIHNLAVITHEYVSTQPITVWESYSEFTYSTNCFDSRYRAVLLL
jgi:hypothetical protein